jgi:AsmA protein
MSRLVKLISLVVVVLIGLTCAAWFGFDPNSLKPRIAAEVERATGRALTIEGPIRVQLVPRPGLTAEDLSLANRPGGSTRPMATVEKLTATIAWRPLLSGTLEIETLALDQPDIVLETDADGIGNWNFSPPRQPSVIAGAPSSPGFRLRTELDQITVENGHLLWRDARTHHDVALGIPSLSDAGGRLSGTVIAQGVPIQIAAAAAPLTTTPWPLDVSLTAVGGLAIIKGSIADPLRAHGYQASVSATLPALDALNAIFPNAHLPPLHDVHVAAALTDAGTAWPDITQASVTVGASDLGADVAGLVLDRLSLGLAKPEDPIALTADGTLRGNGFSLAAQLGPAGLFKNLLIRPAPPEPATQPPHLVARLTLPQGDLAADLTGELADGSRKITGTLTSQRLDIDALTAPHAGPSPAAESPATPPPPPNREPPRSATLISARPFAISPAIFSVFPETSIQVAIQQLIWRHTTVERLTADLVVTADHHVLLDPVDLHLGTGDLAGSLQTEATAAPQVTLRLMGHALPAGQVLDLLGDPDKVTGILDAHAELTATGATPHDLAATLDGHLGLTVVNGTLESSRAGTLVAPLLKGAPAGLFNPVLQNARAGLRCFAVAGIVKHGNAEVSTLLLDSAALDVSGTGEVELGREALDLRLRPLLRIGGNGIAVPVRLTGPWRDLKTAWDGPVDQGKASFSAVIGALSSTTPEMDCAPALAAARDGKPGIMPSAEPKPKSPDIGDLLRGLIK